MLKRKLSKKAIKDEPYQVWNAFIDLLAMESEKDLTDKQKIAQRVWRYDSEVQNGGHLQYFENTFQSDYNLVIDSLKRVGALEFAQLLEGASNQFFSEQREKIQHVIQYVNKALEGEFDKFDGRYHQIEPSINYYLEQYLLEHLSEFVEII